MTFTTVLPTRIARSKRRHPHSWARLLSGLSVHSRTILNRCRPLHHLYVTLADDRKVRTPLDNIEIPRPDKTRPKHVPNTLIAKPRSACASA